MVGFGAQATREFIAEVTRLAGIPVDTALEDTASRAPWYARSVDSTYLTGKRVFVFGDATHAIAAARVAADLLAALEPVLPGIGQSVLTTDVATPYTFWRFTRAWRGSYEGWMPTAERMTARMESTLPGLEGFHMCGQWTQPIAGVPTSLASGREVVKAICELDERAFRTPPRVGPAHERPA